MKTNLVNEHYYKFRSLWNLKYFIDIITNERLYAARYDELNDPMEGAFLIDYHRQNIVRLLKNEKYKTRYVLCRRIIDIPYYGLIMQTATRDAALKLAQRSSTRFLRKYNM